MEKIKEKIVPKLIEDEMKKSYIDYAMSVIVGRALPDARDGLKPVHRRVLFAMNQLGMFHNKPYKKCARIVGETLGKYHAHSDAAVYDTLVRLAQNFSLRYPLIQGQGNFGSIDGDSPAAMRYTEARLNKLAEQMLVDIEKKTVNFQPNFDETLEEPTVLPSKFPNLLLNGSSGIAVGMATNIPPHNLTEITEAIIHVIDNPQATVHEVMGFVKGPDFPTGGSIYTSGLLNAYKFGRGKIRIRAKTNVEEKKDRKAIIVTEIPYQVNKALLVESIASLVREKKIHGIYDLRDESDKEGMRIVIELTKTANPDITLNQLYKHTRMQTTFGINMLALVDNEPKTLSIIGLIKNYIKHRFEVVTRRTRFELNKAEARAHILEGIIVALKNIDAVVRLIKASKTVEIAKKALLRKYKLSLKQAQAILEMRLQRLTSLEQSKILEEHKSLLKLIEELKAILASKERIFGIIKKELLEIKEKFADERRTEIVEGGEEPEIEMEDLIKEEDMIVTITHRGYIKRLTVDTYRQQKRGGKGIIATGTIEEDFVEHLFIANTHSYILFFTDDGQARWLKVYQIPEASRQSKGKAIINLLDIKDQKITAFIPVKKFDDKHYLLLATKNGIVKKTNLEAYSRPRKGGIKGIILDEDDKLITAKLTDSNKQLILASKNGMAVKFHEKNVRPIGRASRGVIGMRLKKGDEIIGAVIAEDEKALLTITENGYGKRTKISEYRLINRGGLGVINIQCTERNGNVVSIKSVSEEDEIMFISRKGIIIRTPAHGISVIGRNTQGVTLMRLSKDDKVVGAAKIIENNKEEEL